LLFGCRDSYFDILFPTALLNFLQDGTLDHLCLCFSRRPFQADSDASLPSAPHLRGLLDRACLPQKCKYVQECMLSADCRMTALGADECPADVATAFSELSMRESVHSQQLLSHADQLAHLVMDCGAQIRVCGDAKGMGPAVASTWVELFARRLATGSACVDRSKGQPLLPEEINRGQGYLAMLKQERRYIEDVWR
uniref:CAP10 domain-containing protein n=1 Tax=Schistocephalus solidus TaxID=70667 RepID=A0A183SR15_SCHSO